MIKYIKSQGGDAIMVIVIIVAVALLAAAGYYAFTAKQNAVQAPGVTESRQDKSDSAPAEVKEDADASQAQEAADAANSQNIGDINLSSGDVK